MRSLSYDPAQQLELKGVQRESSLVTRNGPLGPLKQGLPRD